MRGNDMTEKKEMPEMAWLLGLDDLMPTFRKMKRKAKERSVRMNECNTY